MPQSAQHTNMPQQTNNSKKFGPVQPRLYDWTLNEGGGPNPDGLPTANGHAPSISNGRISPGNTFWLIF